MSALAYTQVFRFIAAYGITGSPDLILEIVPPDTSKPTFLMEFLKRP